MLMTAKAATTAHTHWRDANSRQPWRRSASMPALSSRTARGTRIRAMSRPLTRKVAASTASAQPAPATATSTPATAAPRIRAPLVDSRSTALADCSESAGTVAGTRPVEAGMNTATAVPLTALSSIACSRRGVPRRNSAASSPWLAKARRSAAAMTRWRGSRSAIAPPTRTKTAMGSSCAASTSPRVEAPDPGSSRTAKARATGARAVPSTEIVRAASSSRKGPVVALRMQPTLAAPASRVQHIPPTSTLPA